MQQAEECVYGVGRERWGGFFWKVVWYGAVCGGCEGVVETTVCGAMQWKKWKVRKTFSFVHRTGYEM